VSPSFLVVPSPIASLVATPAATISVDEDQFLEVGAQLELHGSILHDHTQRLDALPPTLFEGYDRDLRELYTRSGVVRDEIFSQRYRFRSLEREQERATVTFSAIWRPVLALEAWAGQTDAQRAALWHAIYDIQRENHDLRRQIAEERRERLELTDRVARMERRQESGGEYGYCKNLKKTVKTGQTRTRERKENTRVGRTLSKENATRMKKTHQGLDFCTKVRTKEAQEGQITDCHAGNPCAHQSDPRAKNRDPMIGKIQGQGFMGASNNLQDLEASLKAI
ncbi:hypothetical protein Tco_0833055, partial [Tanacetum coccineum]